MFLSLGDDGPATAIRFCRFFANVDFDGVEERGKRVEISERHGDFLIGLDPAHRNLQINPEWGLIVTQQNGRASCRDSVCQYVYVSGGDGSVKKERKKQGE